MGSWKVLDFLSVKEWKPSLVHVFVNNLP